MLHSCLNTKHNYVLMFVKAERAECVLTLWRSILFSNYSSASQKSCKMVLDACSKIVIHINDFTPIICLISFK